MHDAPTYIDVISFYGIATISILCASWAMTAIIVSIIQWLGKVTRAE